MSKTLIEETFFIDTRWREETFVEKLPAISRLTCFTKWLQEWR